MQLAPESVKFVSDVESELSATLGERSGVPIGPGTLMGGARHLCLGPGSKRLRPTLVHLFGQAVGAPESALMKIAVSAELIHSASLLHDDVVDSGMYRRGRPTVNALWGNIVAVMGGDLVLTLAIQTLRELDREVTDEAVKTVAEMTRATMGEVEMRGDLSVTPARFREVCEGKTGALFAFCGSAVGLVAKDPEATKRFSAFSRHLGIGFQFADDLLDLTGGDEGKSPFADLKSRTPSLPLLLAAQADEGLRRELRDLWAFTSTPEAKLKPIAEKVLSLAQADTIERVRTEIMTAIDALGPYGDRDGGRELIGWAHAVLARVAV
jgi:octaprenyl-diphosphate synthase